MSHANDRAVGGFTRSISAQLTRPADATAYADGDHIANSTTAGSVVPITFSGAARGFGFSGIVSGARLVTNSATATGTIRLHLFNQEPFAAGGYQADNSALALTAAALTTGGNASSGILNNYIGVIEFATWVAHSSSAAAVGVGTRFMLPYQPGPSSTAIFGLLQARAAITPISGQVFTATLDVQQD
jgi:hypothetical protein